jgi:hypothetical protein
MHSSRDDGRGGIVPGGAAAAAQHVLLAAAPHMGRGGLALLTPPDDNGILDWQQDGIHRIQADRETTERMINAANNAAKPPTLRNSAPPIVEKNPRAGGGHSGGLVSDGLIQGSSNSPDAKSNERSSEDELDASTEGEWIGSAIDTLGGPPIVKRRCECRNNLLTTPQLAPPSQHARRPKQYACSHTRYHVPSQTLPGQRFRQAAPTPPNLIDYRYPQLRHQM